MMGTSTSAAQLAAKLGQAARSLEYSTMDGVREAGMVGKQIFEASLPTRRMANVGKGAKLGARFTRPTSKTNPQTIVSYTGPVHLLNTGAGPHMIYPRGAFRGVPFKKTRKRTAGGRLKLTGGDGGFVSGPVKHPGTKGSARKFAPGAMRKVAAAAPKQIEMATARALRKVF